MSVRAYIKGLKTMIRCRGGQRTRRAFVHRLFTMKLSLRLRLDPPVILFAMAETGDVGLMTVTPGIPESPRSISDQGQASGVVVGEVHL